MRPPTDDAQQARFREQVNALSQDLNWPADLVDEAHGAIDARNYQALDRVLARLEVRKSHQPA